MFLSTFEEPSLTYNEHKKLNNKQQKQTISSKAVKIIKRHITSSKLETGKLTELTNAGEHEKWNKKL